VAESGGYVQAVSIRATALTSPILLAVALLTSCASDPGSTTATTASSAQPSSTARSSETAPSKPASSKPTASEASPSKAAPSAVPPAVPASYVFPVASRSAQFGRTHHDYPATDIFAPCGSAARAVTAGVVTEVYRTDDWTVRENGGATRGGLSVSIVGTDGVRYYGSHLKSVVKGIVPGHRVREGETLGLVGHTGSARSTPCHLHFGISPPCATGDWWNRRGVLSPYPFLTSWQGAGQRSPVKAVAAWKAAHGCPTKAPK
jgi:murein DD-endopeptidase MepM/ murein hydrolase activator NlpD